MCGAPVFPGILDGPADFPRRMERLVAFLKGGFRAPAAVPGPRSEVK
jgi:hypothetical protein